MNETRVYVTGRSADQASSRAVNYHSHVHCPGLKGAGSIRPRDLNTLKGAERCALCWSELRGWDLVAHDAERDGDSEYEARFVREVLSRIRGLEPQDVTPQKKVQLDDGSILRVDFFVHRSNHSPLVIELDGYNKTGRVEDAPAVARDDKTKRRQLEQQRHYEVVPFSNKDLADPHVAIRDIETRMARNPVVATSVPAPDERARREQNGALGHTPPDQRFKRGPILVALATLGIAVVAAFALSAMNDDGSPSTPAEDGSCPGEASIKGNVSISGERIFHEPGWRYYDATMAEECFASAQDAEKAGYRPSQAQ